MDLELIAAPAAEPVTISELKQHLRILHATEDQLIERFGRLAREQVETELTRSLITQQWRMFLPRFPAGSIIELPRPPLVSVQSVTYLDSDGAVQTFAASSYRVLKGPHGGRIEKKSGIAWPATDTHGQAVTVEFTAGYGASAAAVPEAIRNAILMLAEHYYFNRGETSEMQLAKNPVAAARLLDPYRTHGWI